MRAIRRLLVLTIVCLVVPVSISASQQLRGIALSLPGSTGTIAAFRHSEIVYASVHAIAKQADFKTYVDAARGKVEFVVGRSRVKLTVDNPFVVIIDHATNVIEQVQQLPGDVLQRDKEYFAPARAFGELLCAVWRKQLRFDEDGMSMSIADSGAVRAPTPSPSNTASQQTVARAARADSRNDDGDRLAPNAITEETAGNFDLDRATVDARKNGTVVRLHSRRPLGTPVVKEIESGIMRLSVANATIDADEFAQTPFAGEDLRAITASQDGSTAIIELRLGDQVASKTVLKDGDSNDLLVTLYRNAEVGQIMSDEEQDRKLKSEKKKAKWSLDCIVLDAGHGGHDPGAIGMTGKKEKNITLGIALKLGALIETRMKHVKVKYTRDDDTFIELDRRGKIANEAGGKLFISIHCNSTEKKPTTASGTEVYLLRPGRTEEAIRVAEFENSVIRFEKDYEKRYQKLTSDNFILLTMAQSAYVKYSERFAELFHEEVKRGKRMKSLGVKQAGFYVLVGASMPAVLVETGFLSNPKEEAMLASQTGQSSMAEYIFNSIEAFAEEYAKSLKEN